MPRSSEHKKALWSTQRTLRASTALLIIQRILGSGDLLDPALPSFLMFLIARLRHKKIAESRYIADRVYPKSTSLECAFDVDFNTEEDGTHWLNDHQFKMKYRCSREALYKITEKMPVVYQLMSLMHYFGNHGESNSTQKSQFRISAGMIQFHRDRVVEALNSIHCNWICVFRCSGNKVRPMLVPRFRQRDCWLSVDVSIGLSNHVVTRDPILMSRAPHDTGTGRKTWVLMSVVSPQ
eukprot:scaffold101589_cov36-Cyclotella_meneghiniana.AAC.1